MRSTYRPHTSHLRSILKTRMPPINASNEVSSLTVSNTKLSVMHLSGILTNVTNAMDLGIEQPSVREKKNAVNAARKTIPQQTVLQTNTNVSIAKESTRHGTQNAQHEQKKVNDLPSSEVIPPLHTMRDTGSVTLTKLHLKT